MFERFTDRARRAIVLAEQEARGLQHPFITPEHLLLGLAVGEGVASTALTQCGVDADSLRQRVAAAGPGTDNPRALGRAERVARMGAKGKVPFSPSAKKVLELSLRSALQLGHNYIGTEHILLGVLRAGDEAPSRVREVLGADPDEVRAAVMALLGSGSGQVTLRSPALKEAMDRARRDAGREPMTTGHLLSAFVADGDSQAAKALAALGVTGAELAPALADVDVATTSDASPEDQAVTLTIGDTTTVIRDPDLAAALRDLPAGQLRAALRRAAGADPDAAATGSGADPDAAAAGSDAEPPPASCVLAAL